MVQKHTNITWVPLIVKYLVFNNGTEQDGFKIRTWPGSPYIYIWGEPNGLEYSLDP